MSKKIFSLKSLALFLIATLSTPLIPTTFAASGGAVKFEIVAPTTAKVGEAIDVTVRALNSSNTTATDYRGSIIFSADYIGDTLPMQGKAIEFTADDAGQKTFSKGVIFKKAGKQDLFVFDVSDDIVGTVSIVVEEGTSPVQPTGSEITIITPEQNAKIANSTLLVSGTTRKNSKINLNLNGVDVGTVISDDSGLFTKELTDISQDNNILRVTLLDASNAVIATSPDVNFSKTSESSSVYGVTIAPATSVAVSTPITITVEAVSGLSDVSVALDTAVLKATESATSGKYSVSTVAPNQVGNFPVNVTTKTITGESVTKNALATLTTTAAVAPIDAAPSPTFRNVRVDTTTDRVTFSFALDNPPANLGKFKIAYGTGAANLDNEILTQDAANIFANGIYTWYVATLPAGAYTFKIYALDNAGTLIPGVVSDPLMATIGTKSCTISNVGAIHVQTDTSKSVLSWAPVVSAASYNIYKIDADGKYTLFQSTKDTSYTIFLSQGAIVYENFAIKAVCGDGTESADYTNASRVQTGPGMIAFIVVISGILAAFVLRRRAM